MRPHFRPLLTLLSLTASLSAQEAARTWTSSDGRQISAALVEYDGRAAKLKLANGTVSSVPLDRLSGADRDYLNEWQKKRPLKVTLPEVVGVDASAISIELVSEDAESETYVYRTPHFQLESQGKFSITLAKEVARSFEATYELLKALPWDIQPQPAEGKYFRASLYKTKAEYMNNGGPPNSAGVYIPPQGRFLVPFSSIGVREVGSSYRMDDGFDTSTLVHELTHQMMHFWLRFLPVWAIEGTAEYTSILPLKNGKFRVSSAKSGLKNYVDFRKTRTVGGVPEPIPLEDLFSVSGEEWSATLAGDPSKSSRLYFTSYLLVYYFMHMDGKGDGERFIRYLRATAELKNQAEAYERAMEEFKKHPDVKVRPDGSFTYPSSLQPPALPKELFFAKGREELMKKNLQILLDGRSEAALMEEVRAAYRKLAIRL